MYSPLYKVTGNINIDAIIQSSKAMEEEFNRVMARVMMNSTYGLMTTGYKENNMERKFIVIHFNKAAGIVFKDSIEAILPYNDEIQHTEIRIKSGSIFVTDEYVDVVKQMVE